MKAQVVEMVDIFISLIWSFYTTYICIVASHHIPWIYTIICQVKYKFLKIQVEEKKMCQSETTVTSGDLDLPFSSYSRPVCGQR